LPAQQPQRHSPVVADSRSSTKLAGPSLSLIPATEQVETRIHEAFWFNS